MNIKAPMRDIAGRPEQDCGPAANIFWHSGKVSAELREEKLGHCPATVWLTGLSGAGKSTLAYELEKTLLGEGRSCFVLDGDNLRHHLNRDLGFSAADRKENIRRAAEVARLMNQAGLIVITSFISPFREDRAMARTIIGEDKFIEVHVCTSATVCEERDPKGLYAKARAGKIPDFTGISSPYEAPAFPALSVDTGMLTLDQATRALYEHLAKRFG
jgi:adenylyl-sulfate kinase